MVPELEWLLGHLLQHWGIDKSASLVIQVQGLILIVALLEELFTLLAYLNLSACADQSLSVA